MNDLGITASKLNTSSRILKEFDESLRCVKKKKEIIKTPQAENIISKLLTVTEPVSEGIKGGLSKSTVISDSEIIDIIRERHSREWPTFKQDILKLNSKLKSGEFQLSQRDFQVLEEIADALDAECAILFRRMRER